MEIQPIFSPNDLIAQELELELPEETPSEEAVFEMLCDRISWMIEQNMEYLMSLLYRNDVAEAKIHYALSPYAPDPANIGLAKLVMERQKQRIATKKLFGKQPIEGVDEDLKW